MTTLQQHTLARLRAEAERRMQVANEAHERELDRLRKQRSDLADAGDLIVGVMSAIGITVAVALIVWGLL